MASVDTVTLNEPHSPAATSIEAFNVVLPTIKSEILKSRHHWDLHEPKMWSRAKGISDKELVDFTVEKDLIEVLGQYANIHYPYNQVSSGPTAYGTIILGKLRLPAVSDQEGEGFIHVRIHDPPNRGREDVIFHSIFTDEADRDADGRPTRWRAIQTAEVPLKFFNE